MLSKDLYQDSHSFMNLKITILSQSNSLFLFFCFLIFGFLKLKKKSKTFILTVLFLFGLIILLACINLGKAITSQITSASNSMYVSRSVVSNFSDPMDSSLPCSSVHGIFQARILEWASIPFSRGSSWPRDWTRMAGRLFTDEPLEKPQSQKTN